MNDNNNFIRIFAHGSSLMLIIFDFFLRKNDDSNNSSDVLNITLSCQTIYRTCNVFVLRRRIKYTNTIHFDKNMLNSVIRLLYDRSMNDRSISYLKKLKLSPNVSFSKFPNLKKLTFGKNFNKPLLEG